MRCCGTGQSVLVSLCVCRAACFVVFTLLILPGLLCREDARSSVCHIRCVRMPIGYWLPTGAIPANQLSASWPFRWRPDPDGRWSVWLVAVSTGTAGRGGEKGPGRRARDFLGQSLLFLSLFLLSTTLQLESWQLLLAALHCVSHAKNLLLQSQKSGRYIQACPLQCFISFCMCVIWNGDSSQPSRVVLRCLATICPPKPENKNQRMLENALKCSNEYFRHKGPLSQSPFAWLSPPNSPFKVKWWGLS